MRERQAAVYRGHAIARLRRQMVAALVAHLQGGHPRPPDAGRRLWQVFCALSDARGWSEAGPQPIRPSDVAAWASLHRAAIPPHHADILAAMDCAWLAWVRTPEAERVAGRLTGAAFDAMFG